MDTLKVAIYQMDIEWEKPEQNISKIENELEQLSAGIDVLILPEMFTTGFSMQASSLSLRNDHPDFIKMAELSRTFNCSIIGSVWFKDHKHYYNRCIHWKATGGTEYYDKVHLFSLVNEGKFLTQGKNQNLFKIKNWIIKPQICYDLRFPKESYNLKQDPYDLLIYVANWPEKRVEAWSCLLKARAVENQCYTIGVNRTGTEPNGTNYTGQSNAIDFTGKNLHPIPENKEGVFIFNC